MKILKITIIILFYVVYLVFLAYWLAKAIKRKRRFVQARKMIVDMIETFDRGEGLSDEKREEIAEAMLDAFPDGYSASDEVVNLIPMLAFWFILAATPTIVLLCSM